MPNKSILSVLTLALVLTPAFAFACTGNVQGFWEKQPVGSTDAFVTVQEFRIDSKSGTLTVCGSEDRWQSGFSMSGDSMSFGYQRRERRLAGDGSGTFLTPVWTAEFKGVTSEYRVRAVMQP